jgi:hypothetical protein
LGGRGVGQALARELADALPAVGERVGAGVGVAAGPGAGGGEFLARSLSDCVGAAVVSEVQSGAQPRAGALALSGAALRGAEVTKGAGVFEWADARG